MRRRHALGALVGGGLLAFGILMFLAGWHSGQTAAQSPLHAPVAAPVQNLPPIQEVIPLPTPDRQRGQGQECDPVILFYYRGRLYRLQPGPQNQRGVPSSPPEYFPLQPYQGPQIPGLPFNPSPPQNTPDSPGFQPVNPRF